jgi:sulfate-transporting ATPase
LSFFVILAKQRDTAVNVGVKEGLNALHDTKDMDAGSKKKKSNKGQGIPGKVVYIMKNVSKRFDDGFVLFENINLCFFQGAKIGIIGMNGSGKSSLLKIIAGEDTDYEGEAFPVGNAKVGYLPQEPELDPEKTVRENILDGVADKVALLERYQELEEKFKSSEANVLVDGELNTLRKEYEDLKTYVEKNNLFDLFRRIDVAMEALHCPPPDADVTSLSGGEKRRVALCRLLISNPDILLLDEPTNHLDTYSVAWLEWFLSEYRGTVLAITHDRYFLDSVAGWILEIDRGRLYPFQGNYSEWLVNKHNRLELERNKEQHRLKRLKQELEWVNSTPKARQSKNKARLARYEELLNETKTRPYESGQILIPPGPRLGDLVIEARGISKRYDNKILFENLTFNIPRSAIVGVIGANGTGKTTLFRIIAGEVKPDSGSIRLGPSVQLGYVSQMRPLNLEASIYEEISGGVDYYEVGTQQVHVRTYIANFNFRGQVQERLIKYLSGGERNRVHLAKMLKSGANVLLLDEPTNDLDVEVLRNLEEGLLQFPGCVMIISHDRWFLDRMATHIIAFEGNSRVVFFHGNYSAYLEDRQKRLGDSEVQKLKFKKLQFV